jgi:transcriptional regulator with XRE-family HTH domain
MPFDGAKLREARLRRALTLRDLGKLAGVSYDSIHALEVGKHAPRPSTIRKLAAALGVPPDALFSDLGNDLSGVPRETTG